MQGINFSFYTGLILEDVSLKDPNGNLVASMQEFHLDVRWRKLFRKKIQIEEIILNNPYFYLTTNNNGETNLQFLIDIFPKREKPIKIPNILVQLKSLQIINGKFKFEDLYQIGAIGLIRAIDKFDFSFEVKFSTYAVPMIIGEIRRYLRDNNSIRVSRSLRDIAYKALQVKEAVAKKEHREASLEEISEKLDIPVRKISYALDAISDIVSLNEPVYNDGGDTLYVLDQISDKKNKEDNWIEEITLNEAIRRLPDREKNIIDLRFFKGKTQMEVAGTLGISQAQVSRLEKGAIKTMRKSFSLS